MHATATLVETLKDLLAASNPGLATKEDLARLEEQVDELIELVDALNARLGSGQEPKDAG